MRLSTGFTATALGVLALLAVTTRNAQTQVGGTLPGFVQLQTSTPGAAQTGNSNISGTSIAGQFIGSGGGLTNVNANLLDGLDSTAFLQGVPNPLSLSGSQITPTITGTSGSNTNLGTAGVKGVSTASTGATYGVWGTNSSVNGRGVFGAATASTGVTYGGRFESESSTGIGAYGLSTATSGTTYGGMFENNSTTGTGVFGFAIANSGNNFGGFFQTRSNTGIGVRGLATNTGGLNYGGRFESASLSGRGVFGGATATAGVNYGGRFESDSTTGRGAFGLATSSTGSTYGLLGQVFSSDGIGVFGENFADTGLGYGGRFESDSDFGRGVYGLNNRNTGVNYGVRGQTDSPDGYGVFAVGELGATGVKSFRIDHPFDPENKYLLHYAAESPVPQNFYVGNVVTDSKGYAWVELPDYFAEINTNFKYQLTVVDETDSNDFIWAKVVQKIKGDRFRIRTNKPSVEVSWEVKADRNDLYVRAKKIRDVVEKHGLERGKYQHPELYGKPVSLGMDYIPRPGANDDSRVSRP